MHKTLPILALTLLLAACSGGDNESGTANTAAAPATTPAAAVTPEPASPATRPVTASPEATDSGDDSAPAAAGTASAAPAEVAPGNSAGETDAASAKVDSTQEPAKPPAATPVAAPVDTGKWVEGKNYFLLQPQQPRLSTTDKVQVVEVFSYGCPACYHSQPFMIKLAKSLPSYAEMEYLPVAFRPDENFPLYQRAFYTAQAFGVAKKAHDAMFDAVWKSGDIGTYKLSTGRPKPKDEWPDIADIAKFYAQYGVDPKQFVATAKSFAINTKMKRADQLIKNWQVNSTPTIVIDGKYRYTANTAGGYEQMLEMTRWLVQKERHAAQSGQQ